ncbi:MAG: hypothetical protein CMM00_15235 [Rhodopirellula sp.]|nr:hypothetical protein [Rhodopirellula sp.]
MLSVSNSPDTITLNQPIPNKGFSRWSGTTSFLAFDERADGFTAEGTEEHGGQLTLNSVNF